MAVYVDRPRVTVCPAGRPSREASHLFADELDELHEAAKALGLRPESFRDEKDFPHYDITPDHRVPIINRVDHEFTHGFRMDRKQARLQLEMETSHG